MTSPSEEQDRLRRLWQLMDDQRGYERPTLPKLLERAREAGFDGSWRTVLQIAGTSREFAERMPPPSAAEFLGDYLKDRRAAVVLDPWAGPGVLLAAVMSSHGAERAIGFEPNQEQAETARGILAEFPTRLEITPFDPTRVEAVPDLIISAPPWNMRPIQKLKLESPDGPLEIHDGRSYLDVLMSAMLLAPGGEALFVLPDGFLITSNPRGVRWALGSLGLHIAAVISLPSTQWPTSVPSNLVVISKGKVRQLFVGKIVGGGTEVTVLSSNLRQRHPGPTLESGRLVSPDAFTTWAIYALDAEIQRQLEKGQTAAKISELVTEINLGDRSATGGFEVKDNSVFLPLLGTSRATTSVGDLTIKPQNVAQLVLDPTRVSAEYFAGFLNSSLGRRIRERMATGAFIPKSTKGSIARAIVYIAPLEQQLEVTKLQRRIEGLALQLENASRELWRRPVSWPRVERVVNRLHQHDPLADWIEELPFPLASILRTYRASADPMRREDHLLHFFEATAEFLTTILLSAFMIDPQFFANYRAVLLPSEGKEAEVLRRSTMGGWTQLGSHLAKVTRTLLSKPDSRQVCVDLFRTASSDIPETLSTKQVYEILRTVTDYRNEWRGHGPIESQREAERRVGALETELLGLQRHLADVFYSAKIIRPVSSTYRQGVRDYLLHELTGPAVPFAEKHVTIAAGDLDEEYLYLHDIRTTAALRLLPFVRMAAGPSEPNACYFYNRSDRDGIRWISYHHEEQADIRLPDGGIERILQELAQAE